MNDCLRSYRRAQLRGSCRRNPQELIDLYRVVTGLAPVEPLPHGITVNQMIESILDREEGDSKSSGVLRAIAS